MIVNLFLIIEFANWFIELVFIGVLISLYNSLGTLLMITRTLNLFGSLMLISHSFLLFLIVLIHDLHSFHKWELSFFCLITNLNLRFV